MASTAKHEQLVECIETMVGEVDTEAKVLRVRAFVEEDLKSRKNLYLILAGDVRPIEQTSGTVDKEADIFILAAESHGKSDESPHNQSTPLIETRQTELAQGIENKLRAANTQGHACIDALSFDVVNINVIGENREFFKKGWTLIELRVVVEISHRAGDA